MLDSPTFTMLKIKDLELKNNIISAPLAGISDRIYRSFAKKYGAGLVCSEMISATALKYNPNPRYIVSVSAHEHPISMQLFGSNPEDFEQAVKYMEKLGADIIDLNAGCPVPKVMKQQAGAHLLKTPRLLATIIATMRKATTLPLTVKIRSGWDNSSINIAQIAKIVENEGADAITVHPRTRSQGYAGTANWELIKLVKETVTIPVIGNGDITSPENALNMINETGCDGIMIGRAAIGNPWIFHDIISYLTTKLIDREKPLAQRIEVALDHAQKLIEFKGESTALKEMRKFLIRYFRGISNASYYRTKLSYVSDLKELINILDEIKNQQLE